MNERKPTWEDGLYLLALLAALTARLVNLGSVSLTDGEAVHALQAFKLATGQALVFSSPPLYVLPTAGLFALFGSSDFLARLLPALAGSVVILFPRALRGMLGRWFALALAFALALDPALVAASRQAGGAMLAFVFFGLAVMAFWNVRSFQAGVFTGLALLSGVNFWLGLLFFLLTPLLVYAFKPQGEEDESTVSRYQLLESPFFAGIVWKTWLIGFAGSILLMGTAFMIQPAGFGAVLGGLADFFTGWGTRDGVTISQMLISLPVYIPFALIFGVLSIFFKDGEFQSFRTHLVVWGFLVLLFVIIYPGRDPSFLIWLTPVLWLLAVRFLASRLWVGEETRWIAIGQSVLVFVMCLFAWSKLLELIRGFSLDESAQRISLALILASITIILLITLLVTWGWNLRTSLVGLAGGLAAAMLLLTLGASSSASGFGEQVSSELWSQPDYVVRSNLLMDTIGDVAEWNTPSRDGLDLVVAGVDTPALRWMLRNYSAVEFVNALPIHASPSMVLTPMQESLAASANYSGHDFILGQQPAWKNLFPSEYFQWAVTRTVLMDKQMVVLWVRTDRFPGLRDQPIVEDSAEAEVEIIPESAP